MRGVDRDKLAPWLAERVGRHGWAAGVRQLALALGSTGQPLLTPPSGRQDEDARQLSLALRLRGLEMTFTDAGERAVLASDAPATGLDRWGLSRLVLHGPDDDYPDGVWPYALPFDLDWDRETPASARRKLGHDHTEAPSARDPRQSYFLDHRVVEIRFNTPSPGIHRITVVHLLNTLPFGA